MYPTPVPLASEAMTQSIGSELSFDRGVQGLSESCVSHVESSSETAAGTTRLSGEGCTWRPATAAAVHGHVGYVLQATLQKQAPSRFVAVERLNCKIMHLSFGGLRCNSNEKLVLVDAASTIRWKQLLWRHRTPCSWYGSNDRDA